MYPVWEEIEYNVLYQITRTRSQIETNKLYSMTYNTPNVKYGDLDLNGWQIIKVTDKKWKTLTI